MGLAPAHPRAGGEDFSVGFFVRSERLGVEVSSSGVSMFRLRH